MTTTPRIEVPSAPGLWRALRERKRLVLTVVAAFGAFGLALNALTPPVYRATVRVEFPQDAERSPWTGAPEPGGSFQTQNMALYTSAELITNRVILGRLATDLSRSQPALLARSDAKREGIRHWLRTPIARAGGTTAENAGNVEYDPAVLGERVDRLERSITVEPVAETRLVDIRVEDSDPVMAREMADRLARLFVAYQAERSIAADTSGLSFVLNEIAAVQGRIEKTSGELQRLGAATTVKHVRTPVSAGGSEPSKAVRELASVESKLAAARGTYRDMHPKVQALAAEARALRGQLSHPTRGTTSYVTRAVRVAQASPRQAVLQNDLAVDEAIYQRLTARAREIGLTRQMASPAVSIVQPATVEPDPVRPRKLLNLGVCLLAGVLAATGLALVKGSLNRTIRGARDAEELLGLPVLAVIPRQA
jgi:uncharacterized protein involved in exopolysaccharide biosynthesis